MKYALIFSFLVLAMLPGCACQRVQQAHTGILVNQWGSDRGSLTAISEVYGQVVYNPLKYDLFINSNSVEREIWTAASQEGSPDDESLSVTSSDNLTFGLDVGFSWYISSKAGCSARLFRKYQVPAHVLADGELRDIVRDRVQSVFSQFRSDQIAGPQRNQVVARINQSIFSYLANLKDEQGRYLRAEPTEEGKPGTPCIVVDGFRLLQLRMPQQVREAATRRASASQLAQQKREELLQARYDAQKDSITTYMAAENNRMLAESISDQLIRYTLAQGLAQGKFALPTVVGGDDPLSFIINNR